MDRRIRVLRIQHNFVEPTNHRLLDELARFPELEVSALCPLWGIESGNMRVLKTSPRPDLAVARTIFTSHYATTFFIQKLAATISRFQPDIISVHEEPWSMTMAQTLFHRRLFAPAARLVFCSAQNIIKKYPYPFSAIERAAYRTAAAGYGCCEGVRDMVRAKGYQGRFDIIPLGMDPELFQYRPREGSISGRPFIIGYAGRLVKEKGVYTLLRAFAGLRGEARLVMLGTGPEQTPLGEAAAQAGVADRLQFTGAMPHAGVPKFIDSLDALVIPSETTPTWKEQFGRVIPEAFSIGVPVVGSDSGSIPEIIGDAGLVFHEKDYEQLTSLLQALIDHPERLPDMSAKGRNRALRLYTWRRVAEMNLDIFLSVMERQ